MPGAAAPTVSLRLPRALLQYWGGPASIDVEGRNLAEALAGLEERVSGLAGRILDDQGQVRQHVAVFVNGDLIDGRDPSAVPLRPGDRVQIVPAVSGG